MQQITYDLMAIDLDRRIGKDFYIKLSAKNPNNNCIVYQTYGKVDYFSRDKMDLELTFIGVFLIEKI